MESSESSCSTIYDCSERFKCYYPLGTTYEESETRGHCLCNRVLLFRGEDCGDNNPLAFISLTYITIVTALACLEYLSVLLRLLFQASLVSRRSSTPLFTTGFANVLLLLSNLIGCCINLRYLWVFPGFWYEVSGVSVLMTISAMCIAVANLSICMEFYRKLVTVNVVASSFVLKMKWLLASFQAFAFMAAIYGVSTGLPIAYMWALISVPSFLIAFSVFTVASGRIKAFLEQQRLPDHSINDTLVQSISRLTRFSKRFRTCLCAFVFLFLLNAVFDADTSVPAIFPHLMAIANYRISIHLGRIMFCFCLPTSPHLSVSAAVTLMSPEKRLWKIFKVVLFSLFMNRFPAATWHGFTGNSQEHEGNIWRAWSWVNTLQKRLPPSSLSPQEGSLFLNRKRKQKKVVVPTEE